MATIKSSLPLTITNENIEILFVLDCRCFFLLVYIDYFFCSLHSRAYYVNYYKIREFWPPKLRFFWITKI